MDCKSANFVLRSGNTMPLIGFGTFQIHGRQLIRQVLDYALRAGYRQIDTAAVYGNEVDIGIALKELLQKYSLKREDIFITSKLSPSDQGEQALEALKRSVRNLGCDYLDLYLIHWPGVAGVNSSHPNNQKLRSISWSRLVEGVKQNIVRDIGVSNYTLQHLNELFKNDYGCKPSVNQVEWHPYYFQSDLKKFCNNEGILLQAYSSLGGSNNPKLLTDSVVLDTSKKLNRSASQVLLRWALQQNIGIIPKARSQQHIEENIDLDFEISEEFMNKLYNLNKHEKFAWNPAKIL